MTKEEIFEYVALYCGVPVYGFSKKWRTYVLNLIDKMIKMNSRNVKDRVLAHMELITIIKDNEIRLSTE